MSRYKPNSPRAEFLMGAMRSMGYSFEAAIADIIDNSISADARNIHIKFPVDPLHCYVSVLDDGSGMSEEELFLAMRYGCSSSEEERDLNDLGRFGLGMKSASLSQCKVLTVASKHNGVISAYQWNYDVILSEKEWFVIELDAKDILKLYDIEELINNDSGTLIIWTDFDTIEKSSGDVFTTLNENKIKIIDYLSLIFHRYLNDEGDKKLNIFVNNFQVKGLEPFLERHKKTNIRQEFNLTIKDALNIERYVTVQPYVLPYQKDLSNSDIQLLGGIANLKTKQGFYIYRNRRLIIWGTWFGIHRDELTKNARIRVDIPNTLDDIWNIDIKKQNASIPKTIRNYLTSAVRETMELSEKIHNHRGRISKINDEIDYIWNRTEGREKKYTYSINRESRIFLLLKDHVDDEAMSRFEMVLEEIEKNIPFQQLYIDISRDIVDDTENTERLKDIENKGKMWVKNVVDYGELTKEQAVNQLFMSEPFCKYPKMKSTFYKYFEI